MTSRSDEVSVQDTDDAVRRLSFVPALDGVRAVVVLIVIVHHIPAVVPTFNSSRPLGGYLGVDIFFVLSGFLITALLLREQVETKRVRLGAFYACRALRLLPALIVVLVVYDVYLWLFGGALSTAISHSVAIVFYVQNLPHVLHRSSPAYGPLWSLAVEEQFYLVWPLIVVLALGIRRRTWVVVTIIVSMIVILDVRQAIAFSHARGYALIPLYNRTDYRASSLLVGALLAHLWVRRKTPTRGLVPAAWVALAFIVLCVAKLHVTNPLVYRGGFTAFAIAVAVVLLAVLESSWFGIKFLSLAPLRAIGRVSYGLYLWHVPVFLVVFRYGSHISRLPRLLLALVLVAAVVSVSRVFVERPILRWKNRHVEPPRAPAT